VMSMVNVFLHPWSYVYVTLTPLFVLLAVMPHSEPVGHGPIDPTSRQLDGLSDSYMTTVGCSAYCLQPEGSWALVISSQMEISRVNQGRPPQPGPEGSQKNPRGSAPKVFACGALCHRAGLTKQPRFFARLPKTTSAPQANAPQASKIGRAARFWGILRKAAAIGKASN
jgi:hypothetical protein